MIIQAAFIFLFWLIAAFESLSYMGLELLKRAKVAISERLATHRQR